ncbi:MAG: sugar transporter [Cycloclasticus sp.]|nr:sugar transporter [Cycloclasticus sp.]MBG96847.1 sugar transporter [Cycloclasticus sp.]|tara:strand:- start:1648 stop:2205 length:558 start_codon:yes stop_codon:yes gene_type:complete
MKNFKLYISFVILCVSLFSNTVQASGKYLLNSGDVLDISVWNEDALQKSVVVLPDGTISFPLAGVIHAEGKSVRELEAALKKSLEKFLTDPSVSVVVAQVSGNTIHVLGKVSNPGSFEMSQQFSVMQALSLSGGLSPYAKENSITVLRTIGGSEKAITVRYADIKSGSDLSTNIKLQSGDVIVVP